MTILYLIIIVELFQLQEGRLNKLKFLWGGHLARPVSKVELLHRLLNQSPPEMG
jgi:hypothetical protein